VVYKVSSGRVNDWHVISGGLVLAPHTALLPRYTQIRLFITRYNLIFFTNFTFLVAPAILLTSVRVTTNKRYIPTVSTGTATAQPLVQLQGDDDELMIDITPHTVV